MIFVLNILSCFRSVSAPPSYEPRPLAPPPLLIMAAVQNPAQPQQYCLRWNNHQHNLLSVFEDLLNHEAFVDVTIACDGLNLKAHKIVLSACSPYFQSMFYNTPDKHPVVFLKDVRYDEMKALLEFMYRGEVSVDQENLSSLLKVAEGLKIKGLADVSETHASAAALTPVVSAVPRLSGLPLPPAHLVPHLHPALLSPEGSVKRLHSSTSLSPNFNLGPKRKRGRPRRLSGSEAVPLALSLVPEQELEAERGRSESRAGASPLALDSSESEQSPIKSLKEGSRALSLSPGGEFYLHLVNHFILHSLNMINICNTSDPSCHVLCSVSLKDFLLSFPIMMILTFDIHQQRY